MKHYSKGNNDTVKIDEEFLKNKGKVQQLSKLVPHDLYMYLKEKRNYQTIE